MTYYYNCGCGSTVHTYKTKRHEKSKKHKKWVEYDKRTTIYLSVSNSNITAELGPSPSAGLPSESKILTDNERSIIGSPK